MVIKLIENKEIWDRFVDRSNEGLLFHKWDFLKIMSKYTNCELLPYGIYNNDELICIFPLFFKKSRGLKMIFSPPQRTGTQRLGFVMHHDFANLRQNKKETYLDMMMEGFHEEIKKISPNYMSISLVPNFLDVRTFQWNNYDTSAHYTYMFNLNLSLDEIWNGFSRTLKTQIKNIDDSNLKILQSNDISMFYESEEKRYKEKGIKSPIISKNYLEDLFKAYPENLKLYYLYDGNNIITVQINCEYKDMVVLWLGGGGSKSSQNKYAYEYMTWDFIKQAKNAGYKKMDWGGGPVTISQFKSKFNPVLGTYFTIQKKDILGKFAEWVYLNFMEKIYTY